jgi:hypothetical protein
MDLYYPRPNASELVVTLRASVLSPLPSQIRYSIKGSTGSFVKYGMDIQFPHLQSLGQNKGASFEGYGKEPEDIWGTVYETNAEGTVMGQDGVRFNVSK